jgi:hypothetical protein
MFVLFFSYLEYVGAANTVLLRGARRKTLFFILFLGYIFCQGEDKISIYHKKYSTSFFIN